MTARELNRATLARQLLLVRGRGSVARTLLRIAAVQSQDLHAPYGAFQARLDGFDRAALDRALVRRSVVKATLMRGTLHMVAARDYPFFVAALMPALRRMYTTSRMAGASPRQIAAIAERAVAFGSEPRTNREYREHLGHEDRWFRARFSSAFVHAPPLTRQSKLVSAEAWLGVRPLDEQEAAAYLVERYLAAFGPATAKDASRWAGLPIATVRAAFERVRHVDLGDGLVDLAHAPRPGHVSAPPRLLALFDELLLAYDDRSRIVPDEYLRLVNVDGGIIRRTFTVDGVVAGLWRTEGRELTLEPFAPLPRVAKRELVDEARRTAAFYGATRVRFT